MPQPAAAAVKERIEAVGEAYLADVMETLRREVIAMSPSDSSLITMADYHLGTGGKRLRALLPLLVAEALGVEPRRVVPFAAACEILHNATLVHDDLQDGDTVRRGQDTVWVRYGAARAINLGDAMLYWALGLVRKADFPIEAREQLADRMVRDTLRVIDGQEREFLLKEMARPTLADYFRMVQGKTSGLFALPIAGTAALCGADEATVSALEEAAGHLGVLFQIQDDVLDLYGDKGRDVRGTDLAEGKISALVVHLYEHGAEQDVEWLRALMGRDRAEFRPEEAERADAMFRESGSLAFVLEEIARRREAVVEILQARDADLAGLMDGIGELFCAPIAAVRP